MTLLSKLPGYGFDTQLLLLIGHQLNQGWSNKPQIPYDHWLTETCDHSQLRSSSLTQKDQELSYALVMSKPQVIAKCPHYL